MKPLVPCLNGLSRASACMQRATKRPVRHGEAPYVSQRRCKNKLHDAENQGTPTGEAWDNLILEVELSAAIELSSRTLEITATFEDGSELTRSYRIFSVPDFEEIWLRNEEACNASFEEGAPAYEPEQLYAL